MMFVVHSFTIFVIIFSLNLQVNISLSFLSEGSVRVAETFHLENAWPDRLRTLPILYVAYLNTHRRGKESVVANIFLYLKKLIWPVLWLFFTLSELESWFAKGSQGGIIDLCWGGGRGYCNLIAVGPKSEAHRVGQRQRQEKKVRGQSRAGGKEWESEGED